MKRFQIVSIVIVCISCMLHTACVEEISTEARYTFRGETVASYLQKHEETFSHFINIVQRGGYLSLLKAYGSYTCFAPTNEAIERYIVEQDSIWRASVAKGSARWTGITSPNLEDLTDSMCIEISRTHILPKGLLTMEMEGDIVPAMNLNDRYLTLSFDVNDELRSTMFINGSRIISGDNQTENGVVHVVNSVLNPSTMTVPELIDETSFLTLYSAALKKTRLDDVLTAYKDVTYTEGDKRLGSKYGLNVSEYPSFPPARYFGFTAFCVPDDIFHEMGIYTLNDLYQRAKGWYPEATDDDFTSDNNALRKFMKYHLLDRKILYTRMVCYNIVCGGYFNSESRYAGNTDRYDYLETLQGTILKFARPLSNFTSGMCRDGVERTFRQCNLLNYTKDVINRSDPFNSVCGPRQIPVNIRVQDPQTVDFSKYPDYLQEALNGSVLLIDHPLIFDEEVMMGSVLNEQIRIDFSSLFPELTNNHMRWYDCTADQCDIFYIPNGYCKDMRFYSDAPLFYCIPRNYWTDWEGDDFHSIGSTDFAVRIPHIPAGTYEVRMGFSTANNRGIFQFYFDDEIAGIPIDMRLDATNPKVGWVADADTDDNGVTNDKQMKNRGYLKGSNICLYDGRKTRDIKECMRLVLTTKYLGEGDHWIRAKNVHDQDDGLDYYHLDYLEFVPVGWLRREDISLAEKRR